MFDNLLRPLTEVEKKIQRQPKPIIKEKAINLNYRGEKSLLLEELNERPILDDLPF